MSLFDKNEKKQKAYLVVDRSWAFSKIAKKVCVDWILIIIVSSDFVLSVVENEYSENLF